MGSVTVPVSFRPQKLDIKLYLQIITHHTMNLLLSSIVVILAVSLPQTEGECIDHGGFFRRVGDVWKVDCNTCRCLSGGQHACTLIGCLDRGRQDFVSRGDRCFDPQMNRFRLFGESWMVDCNTCRCFLGGGIRCTERGYFGG